MLTLGTSKARFHQADGLGPQSVIRVCSDRQRPQGLRSREAFLLDGQDVPKGFALYIAVGDDLAARPSYQNLPLVALPETFAYVAGGDILRVMPSKRSVRILFRRGASINSFLLTERCNNYCLMCSQPPRDVDDGWIADEIIEVMRLIDVNVPEIMFSGGEPTLLGERFLDLVSSAKALLPHTALHVLSNGRKFTDVGYAKALGAIRHSDLMVGIPLYSELAHVHDYVVQADGAYDDTIRGILNLRAAGVRVELRVVLHKQTVPRLAHLAEFITRNLLFVDQVVFMGLEMTGFTKANLDSLWIDPFDYVDELSAAVGILDRARIKTSIYNTQLCLIPRSLWPYARRSISDWKQEYMPQCDGCAAKQLCGGFFSSASVRFSSHIKAIETVGCEL